MAPAVEAAYCHHIGFDSTSRSLMSRVARRKQLLSTPAMSRPAIADEGATSYTAPPATPVLHGPDGRRIRVVHIVAELAPFARSGGLGEAVNSLARFQSARGIPTSIMMP